MKTLYVSGDQEEQAYVAKRLAGHELVFLDGTLQDAPWEGAGVECLCVFVSSQVGRAELDKLPDVRFIATRSTGYDHIDLSLARERGIAVATVPSYGEHTVAEYAFALLLALSRKVLSAHERVMEGAFSSEGLTGFDLYGRTIGVIGTGKIGKNVVRIAKGFGMDVLAFDLHPDDSFASEVGCTYHALPDVLARADIISLHLPATADTHHILNIDIVSKMKRGVVVINTARGSLVETDALVYGLREGIIAAAGLDVLDEEGSLDDEMKLLASGHPKADELKTLLLNHYLIEHPRVLITPHNAFNTTEALRRILDVTVENITGFAAGDLRNVVVGD